ncbi:MAG: hypothetical protein K5891_04095, partial [Lachnospiraceae bacterium]|nr:hypothetical protein [Lachnospiraceae bacterium]
HLLVKAIFFSGYGNSYDQMSLSAIGSPASFAYMVYAFFYYLAAILTALLVVPVVCTLVLGERETGPVKSLTFFVGAFSIVCAATVAYTISVREDLGRMVPRVHMRYIGPILLLYLLLFLRILEKGDLQNTDRKPLLKQLLLIASVYVIGIFRGVTRGSSIDQYILEWYAILTVNLPRALFGGNLPNVWIALAINLALGIAVWIFYHLSTGENPVMARRLYIIAIVLVCLVGNIAARSIYQHAMAISGEEVAELQGVQCFLEQLPKGTVVAYYTDPEEITLQVKKFDTYIDHKGIQFRSDRTLKVDGEWLMTGTGAEPVTGESLELTGVPEYIILEKDAATYGIADVLLPINLEGISQENYYLYRVGP